VGTRGGKPGGRPATRRGAPPNLPIDSSLFFRLVRVVNLTARPFVETLSRTHELTLNEWRVMVVLASHPGVAATEVADATGLDKMSVSRAIAALARKRRLLKSADPADGRRTLLSLSAAGRGLFQRIGESAAEREAQLFAGVSAAEQEQMARTIDRLIEALRGSEAEEAQPNGTR
jgi:DNA-binding MarR family transcriptional regulator